MCHFASLSFDFRKTGLSEIWNNEWEPAIKHRELNLPLCDDLDGWDGVGCTGAPRGGDICMHMADSLPCTAGTNTTL